ncbi:terpenoid synthase [Aspergillus heteromorphus CBS 117.55]|uniref:Terpenoid synthase n=1 Tax=Aspergillus heteromorphus CBS 117.55 TaxID=1448321 RepID=A0A317WSC4_9EURO|nr:terpenoid synthase [Aspergillus heteromorphus CBS 117.55]PWY88232.1 terpenoid synthase [Aspergillus heteromorphus CBS 117.55]
MNHERFKSIFPIILNDALDYARSFHASDEMLSWFEKSLTHNTTNGKHLRGLLIPNTLSHILSRPLASSEFISAAKLGWLLELLQASVLMCDDIEDGDVTRRGKASWHAVPGVGLRAINDAAMLESTVFALLKRYFRDLECYVDLVEVFHETVFRTGAGQMVDLISSLSGNGVGSGSGSGSEDVNGDVCSFAGEWGECVWERIGEMKTAYYTVYAPVVLAMYLGRVATEKNLERVRSVALRLGVYYQVQDDFLDIFGEQEVFGKELGRDIRDGKCTWLIAGGWGRADEAQKRVLREWYGCGDGGGRAVEMVRGVFREVGMEEAYAAYEEEMLRMMEEVIADIEEGSSGLKKGMFTDIIHIMYKRRK